MICECFNSKIEDIDWEKYDYFSGNEKRIAIKKKWESKTFSLPNNQKKKVSINKRENKVHTLLTIKKIFDQNSLTFYLDGGTLLGAMREKDFIKHDVDSDIVIYIDDLPILEKITPQIINSGFTPIAYNSFCEICFASDIDYLDVRFRPKSKYNKKLDTVPFLDTEFNIPNNVDKYLTIMYGNWRIPTFQHSWTFPK